MSLETDKRKLSSGNDFYFFFLDLCDADDWFAHPTNFMQIQNNTHADLKETQTQIDVLKTQIADKEKQLTASQADAKKLEEVVAKKVWIIYFFF